MTLRPQPHSSFYAHARTDASGRAVIERLPAGRYQLHVSGGEYGDVVEMVEIAGRLERSVALGPASWMTVDLDAPPGDAGEHAILALVTSGGDPGWPHRSRTGDLPIAGAQFSGKPVRIKILPGAYRVRFEVKESHATSRDLAVRELDIVVPPGGEASVRLPLGR